MPKSDCYIDKVSVLKDDIEERSNSDLEEEQPASSWAKALFGKRTSPYRDPDAIATRRSVFDDPRLAPFYWPKQDYENIHRFDPFARWTYREEKALLRRVDWRIMSMVALGCFAVNLDRVNINQANSASFLTDLRLTTDDFNLGNTVNRLAYLFAELPSQLISKRIGADRWAPMQICLWSIVSLSQFWLKGRTSFLACRALLGCDVVPFSFAPALVLYMTYFYTKTELPIRLAGFWMSISLCDIIASFMAYGIFHLNDVAGGAGWQWLFLIEGLLTLAIGVASFFNLPPSPTQTKTWFRPKGWFTEREEVIIVNKVLRDDPTKGDMHNREPLTLRELWTALCDYDLWPVYILGVMSAIPGNPPTTYLTLLLRHAGQVKAVCSCRSVTKSYFRFNTFNTTLLTIPSEAMGIVSMLLIVVVSEFVGERTFVSMMGNVWMLPFLVALYALPSKPNSWLIFGLLTGLLSYPYAGWCSRNAGAVASRTVNTPLYSMFVQASIVISSQIYVASDAPRYERGNRILIIICLVNVFLLYPGTKAYYIWRNRQRAKIWDAMTPEATHYLNTTKDVGNKRLDFRFAH
ncbi:allantoate permease [Imleria badia]|nr:allantoate permease [Imleria badia]